MTNCKGLMGHRGDCVACYAKRNCKRLTCHPDGEPCTCTRADRPLCPTTEAGDLSSLYEVGTGRPAASPPAQVEDDGFTTVHPPLTTGGSLPDDAEKRLEYPMADGLLDYFPNALAEVARLSHKATLQHHPDQPMHWDRGKSTDHANKIIRHLVDRGKLDDKGLRHSTMVAWRALALLQEELEQAEGLPPSRASRNRPY